MKVFRKLVMIVMLALGSIALTGCRTVQADARGLPPLPPIPVPK